MSARRRAEKALSQAIAEADHAQLRAVVTYLRAALAPIASGAIDDLALKRAREAFENTGPGGRYAPH